MAEFDRASRSRSYLQAHDLHPEVRRREAAEAARRAAARPGDVVVELGPGSGLLTRQLLAAVGPGGRVVGVDDSGVMASQLKARLVRAEARILSADGALPFEDGSVDLVVSLANFHHFADKPGVFRDIARILRPGGRVMIADVAHDTPVQRYFDEVVDRICSTGHRHTFLSAASARTLCAEAGLRFDDWTLVDVPWEFGPETVPVDPATVDPFVDDPAANDPAADDPAADDSASSREPASVLDAPAASAEHLAGWFLQKIHDAQCSPNECFDYAENALGFRPDGSSLLLSWQLAYLHATKTVAAPKTVAPDSPRRAPMRDVCSDARTPTIDTESALDLAAIDPQIVATQLGQLNERVRMHASRLWQLPFAYVGVAVLLISSLSEIDHRGVVGIACGLVAVLGVLVVWCMVGAYEGVARGARAIGEIERSVGLSQTAALAPDWLERFATTKIDRLSWHFIPYFSLAIVAALAVLGVWLVSGQPTEPAAIAPIEPPVSSTPTLSSEGPGAHRPVMDETAVGGSAVDEQTVDEQTVDEQTVDEQTMNEGAVDEETAATPETAHEAESGDDAKPRGEG
ncbi:MAG: class I SAM-dependent methyltransferase [Acidobacteriota bacterium]